MTIAGYKNTVIGLSAALAAMSAIAVWCAFLNSKHEVEAVLVDNWAMVLDEMRESGLAHTNAAAIASTLTGVDRWYHGPNPADGGQSRALRNRMDRLRAGVERDLMRHLRDVTGKDLGDDPKLWIQKYAKPDEN